MGLLDALEELLEPDDDLGQSASCSAASPGGRPGISGFFLLVPAVPLSRAGGPCRWPCRPGRRATARRTRGPPRRRPLTTSLARSSLLAQLVAQGEDLLNRDRGVEHDLQDAPVAFLDALGDLDFALTRQQRNGPHPAHVRPHRIAGRGVCCRRPLLPSPPAWPRSRARRPLLRPCRRPLRAQPCARAVFSTTLMPSSANVTQPVIHLIGRRSGSRSCAR